MAGGGQVRPMGGAIQSALNSGQGIGNFVNSALGANPNPAPMRGNPAVMPSMLPSDAANYPKRGEEGNFYGTPAQALTPTIAPQGNFNVNQAAAGGLQQAMQGTQAAMGYSPAQIQATGYNPTMQSSVGNQQGFGYNAGQLAGSDLSAYENPYEDQVVQNLSLIHI